MFVHITDCSLAKKGALVEALFRTHTEMNCHSRPDITSGRE